jgi:hypothetical protein
MRQAEKGGQLEADRSRQGGRFRQKEVEEVRQ